MLYILILHFIARVNSDLQIQIQNPVPLNYPRLEYQRIAIVPPGSSQKLP